jgi:hypothetical protein
MKLIPSELFTVDLETPIRHNKLVNDLFLKNEVKIQYVYGMSRMGVSRSKVGMESTSFLGTRVLLFFHPDPCT